MTYNIGPRASIATTINAKWRGEAPSRDQCVALINEYLEASPSFVRIDMTGEKLRRIIILRNEGSSWSECGRAASVSHVNAKRWWNRAAKIIGKISS
jgi:hypothetical protein